MQDHELYHRILGIESPWRVERVERKMGAGEVHVFSGKRGTGRVGVKAVASMLESRITPMRAGSTACDYGCSLRDRRRTRGPSPARNPSLWRGIRLCQLSDPRVLSLSWCDAARTADASAVVVPVIEIELPTAWRGISNRLAVNQDRPRVRFAVCYQDREQLPSPPVCAMLLQRGFPLDVVACFCRPRSE